MDSLHEENFYEALGIPEDATDEQIDRACEGYVSKHQLSNPEDANSALKYHTLMRIKEVLKHPEKKLIYQAQITVDRYKDIPIDDLMFRCAMADLTIEKFQKHVKSLERRIQELEGGNKANAKLLDVENAKIGMTKDDVRAIAGEPQSINREITEFSNSEGWHYDGGYLSFKNGKLTYMNIF